MTSFNKDLIASFIPRIKEMVRKERRHLARMKFYRLFMVNTTKADVSIERSQWWLDHYTARLRQYERYVAA